MMLSNVCLFQKIREWRLIQNKTKIPFCEAYRLLTHFLKNRCCSFLRSSLTALIIIYFIKKSAFSVESAETLLSGNLQSCLNEGEEVKLRGIPNSQCFKCTCLNGFVNCDKESCPSIDECYLLDSKVPETCCRKCKDCRFRGILYASGSEWTDPDNPCRIYKCIASVVTETNMQCYTQCESNQTLAPLPGECCPTCQGCSINEQIISEGQEAVASIDDRCLVCKCTESRLSCNKKTCPILHCPISKQLQKTDECCPRCTEHREFMPLTDKCIFSNRLYYDKMNFSPDRCTNCTCINGTSVCQRKTCPILECAPENREVEGCCPRCALSEVRTECSYNGILYHNNQTWKLSPCRSCRCTAGNIRCSEMRCPIIKCRPNEEMKVDDQECCAKCVETAGSCTVFGDPHFKTFDGKFFSFQGSCKYLLAADCHDHSFSIRLTNDARSTKRSSWTKTVTLKLQGLRINLGQKMRVKVNGTRISMPYNKEDNLKIERLYNGIILKTESGIIIEWDGSNFLQVIVPSSYKNKLCGLCGNYNGIVRDDLISRDGFNYSDREVWRFANSWKVGGPKACSRKSENVAIQPNCKHRKSNFLCQSLQKSEVFGKCDSRLNPIHYIESCKMDICECPTEQCHCDSFAAYAHECQRIGVNLPNWRLETKCEQLTRRTNSTKFLPTSNSAQSRYNIKNQRRSSYSQTALTDIKKKDLKRNQYILQLEHNQLLQKDYVVKHVPKNLLSKYTDQAQPPLQ